MRYLLTPPLVLALALSVAPADEKLAGVACRSVHLGFPAPDGVAFYHEAAVEASAPGTFFMTCGWSKGYFGLQELDRGRKVALFSVWDPAAGDDPKTVPEAKRVRTLTQGGGVRVGRFGGEGTGGQAFLPLDWKAGEAYRFLVTARPDGPGRTAYAGYLAAPDEKGWRHVATFSTPTGGELLKGYYSFVEDFRRDTTSTTFARRARFTNGWVRTAEGDWGPLSAARFTADANPATTIDAGPVDGGFFLATGGKTENATTKLGARMTRGKGRGTPPADLPGPGG